MNWQDDKPFAAAVAIVLRHEGGYSNDPSDPGGETNFGISKRSYPDLDIKSLTQEQACEIYYRDWWLKYGYGRLPLILATKALDIAVPSGPHQAAFSLQRGLRAYGGKMIKIDGDIGPATVNAADSCSNIQAVLAAMRADYAAYCRQIAAHHLAVTGKPDPFLEGWLERAYS